MAKAKRSRAELEAMMAVLQGELAERDQAAAKLSLTGLRKQLREHRLAMRQVPGGLISLDDERIEQRLIRAIELARAPAAAQHGNPDGLERSDGATSAGLSGTTAADVNELDDEEEAPPQG